MSDLHPGVAPPDAARVGVAPTPDWKSRDAYPLWTRETIRFNDLDAYGHVNNNAIGVLIEQGRCALLQPLGLLNTGSARFVLAKITMEFRAEMNIGETIDIGVKVPRLGTSSMTIACGLFRGDTCCATSEAIGVLVDWTTRKSTALPAELRAKMLEIAG